MNDKREDIESHNDATYDHVIKYTGLFGGVQGITMLMNVIRNKLVSVLLGPEGQGIVSILNNIIKLISQSTNFGVAFSAVKYMAETHESGDTEKIRHYAGVVRTCSVTTGLLGMVICMLFSHVISMVTFQNSSYTLPFIIIAPAIACLSISGGELAILKGTKELKKVAMISVLSSVSALLICVPIYYLWGISGIAASLLLTTVAVTVIQTHYSRKVVPWEVDLFGRQTYKEGTPMIKLGVGYIIAGIFGQGSEYVIRWFINNWGGAADVGLYNSGYVMAVTYASLVFIAIEADYFPRLSAVKDDKRQQNSTVNQQIEVCVLLIAPILILFVAAMPLIVVILFSSKFVAAIPMAICASFYMFFKALTLPAAYLSLAHGDSRMYMGTELVYDIFIAIAIPFAYWRWGLEGTGLALSVAGLVDLVMIHTIYRHKYHYVFSTRLLTFYILQFILLAVAVGASRCSNLWLRIGIDALTFVISAGMSLRILGRETTIIQKIKLKLKK